MINEPSWDVFNSKSSNKEDDFEKYIAKRLFCAECNILPEQLVTPPGYPGIESEPIQIDGEWVSYQAKFSNDGKQNVALFDKLKLYVAKTFWTRSSLS